MKRATILLTAYIRALSIDNFAVAIETAKGVEIAIVAPDTMINCIESDAPVVERRNGEMFARLKRTYTATKTLPYYRPIARFTTPYKSVKDIPVHRSMRARGLEIVVCNALNTAGDKAKHTGDDISKVDVISEMFGNVECKFGGARMYHAGGKSPKNKGGEK